MTSCVLHQGDCLDVMLNLDPKSIAMCFADLPYGITKQNKWDKQIPLSFFWHAVLPVLNKGSVIAMTATQPFASYAVQSNIASFRYDLIWDKRSPTGHLNANRQPLRRHEHVLIFAKGKHTYNPQKTTGTPYIKGDDEVSSNYNTCIKRIGKRSYDGLRYPTSIIAATQPRKLHPTAKPIALLEWLIATYCNAGDTVLDPVFGSATTAIACARLGRNFVGIEKDPKYFSIGTERVNAERATLGLPPAVIHSASWTS